MGTRTYSRRASDGTRKPTALGIATGRFNAVRDSAPTSQAFFNATDRFPREIPMPYEAYGESETTESLNKRWAAEKAYMREVYKAQGFDGKPKNVPLATLAQDVKTNPNNYLQRPDGEPIVLTRIVNNVNNMDDLINGEEHHIPRQPGWFGTGTYFRTQDDDNNRLSERIVSNFSFVEMYGRKTDEYRLSRPSGADMDIIPGIMLATLAPDTKTNMSAIDFTSPTTIKQSFSDWVQQLQTDFYNQFKRSSINIGLMASALGYDAIMIPEYSTQGEFLVFNRSKLTISEAAEMETYTSNDYDNDALDRFARTAVWNVADTWESA